ncbi:MAG TPA: TolC family protein [Gemmatimonadaceae bacterium]|nr:TolC family protein [Gemmatimonadaceae bacterium]
MRECRIRFLTLALVLGVCAGARASAQATGSTATRQLSLDDALRAAESASEDVAIAEAGVERAHGQQYQARSQFLPQITGSASYTRTLRSQFQRLANSGDTTSGPPSCNTFESRVDTTAPLPERIRLLESSLGCSPGGTSLGSFQSVGFGAANQYNLGLSVSQNVFTGGRITAQARQANAARTGAEIALTSARAQVMLDVAQAYYDAVLADRLLNISQATLAQAETTLSQTRLAKQVGNQPEFELLRARVTRDNQIPVVIQQRSARDLAYLNLKQLLKLPLDEQLDLTTSLDDTATSPGSRLAELLATPLDTSAAERSPVRQARQTVLAQRSAVAVARAERLPTVTLSSAFGRVAFPTGFPSWDQFLTNWTVTASLQLPIFLGGAIRGDKMIAEANEREAEARLRQTRQLAAVDTRNAIAQLRAAEAQYAASAGTEDQASRAYDIAQLRYREGISTQTELSASRIQLQQARANRAQATRDLQVARLRVALIHDLPLSSGGVLAASAQTAIPTSSAQPGSSSLGPQRAVQAQGVPGQPPIPGQAGSGGAAGASAPTRNRGVVP